LGLELINKYSINKMPPTIKTKSLGAPIGNYKEDGERYLITRYWAARPKSAEQIKIVDWLRVLAPSKELHRAYFPKDKKNNKKRISANEYIKWFNREKTNDKEFLDKINEIRNRDSNVTITFLCSCDNGDFCHRHLLKAIIELGYEKYISSRAWKNISYNDDNDIIINTEPVDNIST
jgi:uncharacterized protein YeaO (DUF488 family)